MVTLQRVQAAKKDSVKSIKPFTTTIQTSTTIQTTQEVVLDADGEIVPPPRK